MVEVIEAYFEGKESKCKFKLDKKGKYRPAWIKIVKSASLPKFIKVIGKDKTFHYYKHKFGDYFLPVNLNLLETKRFYQTVAREFDKINENKNNQFGYFILRKLSELNVPKNTKILDVCAGTGIQSRVLIENGYKNITLLDFSKEMLDQAKKKKLLRKNAKFVLADLTKFFSKKKYGIVVSSMGLNYFHDHIWNKVLVIIKNCLKKDGLALIVEDNQRGGYPSGFEIIEEDSMIIDLGNGKKSANFFFALKKNNVINRFLLF